MEQVLSKLSSNTILDLDLSHNNIGEGGAREIAQSLLKNSSLTTLDLGGNNISSSLLAQIQRSLSKRLSEKKTQEAERIQKEEERKKTAEKGRKHKEQESKEQDQPRKKEELQKKENIFQAQVKEALVITSSDYRPTSTFRKLPSAAEDGRAMKEFLEKECLFEENDIVYLPDKKQASFIEREFRSMEASAAMLSRLKQQGLYFIYYSGHGTSQDGHTYGHTVTGERFDLDQMVKALAMKANTFVIAFFDCCREVVQHKGGSTTTQVRTSIPGQFVTIYATPLHDKAMSLQSRKLSFATEAFLDLMRSNGPQTTFRLSFLDWPMKALHGIQYLDQAHMDIYLYLKPNTATPLPNKLSKNCIDSLFVLCDQDENGYVSLQEFYDNRHIFSSFFDATSMTMKDLTKLCLQLNVLNDDNQMDNKGFGELVTHLYSK